MGCRVELDKGDTFGKWTVLGEANRRLHGEFAWLNPVPEKPVSTDTSPAEQNNEPNSN